MKRELKALQEAEQALVQAKQRLRLASTALGKAIRQSILDSKLKFVTVAKNAHVSPSTLALHLDGSNVMRSDDAIKYSNAIGKPTT